MENEMNKEKEAEKKKEKTPENQKEQEKKSMPAKSWIKTILWTIIGLIVLFTTIAYIVWPWVSTILRIEIPGWVFQAIVIAFFIWFLFWIRLVGPNEHGIKKFLGSLENDNVDKKTGKTHGLYKLIYGYCKSGIHLVPRLPGCGIEKIPKTRFELSPKPRITVSKRTEKNNEKFGKQFLLTEAGIYTEFGQDYKSVRYAVERGTPRTKEGLTDFSDTLIDSSIREAIGSMDWAEATEQEGREKIRKTMENNINDPGSIFVLGGLDTLKTQVMVKMIDLESKELKKAMVKPDFEKFQKEGAAYEAQRIKLETEIIGDIRETLAKKGFSAANVDKIAHDIYELQVSRDLQEETGLSVVKLIRFQSNSSLGNVIGESVVAAGAVGGLLAGETMKTGGKGSERKEEYKSEKKERVHPKRRKLEILDGIAADE